MWITFILLIKADYTCTWQFYHSPYDFKFSPFGKVGGSKTCLVIIILREYNISRRFLGRDLYCLTYFNSPDTFKKWQKIFG